MVQDFGFRGVRLVGFGWIDVLLIIMYISTIPTLWSDKLCTVLPTASCNRSLNNYS